VLVGSWPRDEEETYDECDECWAAQCGDNDNTEGDGVFWSMGERDVLVVEGECMFVAMDF